MFNLRNMAHSQPAKSGSRTGREVKVRMGLFLPLEWNEWVSEERSVSVPKVGSDYKVLTAIYCHLVAAYSICRLSAHTLAKALCLTRLPTWCGGKESTRQCRRCERCRFNPWLRKIPWRGNGSPLKYSCPEHPMDRGTWWATVQGVTKSRTGLSMHAYIHKSACWSRVTFT